MTTEPIDVRLTRIEERQRATLEATTSGQARTLELVEDATMRITTRLDTLNGSVARNAKWITDHAIDHAHEDGVRDGQSALRQRDYVIIGGIITVATFGARLLLGG